MKLKKIISFALCLAIVFAFAGCSKSNTASNQSTSEKQEVKSVVPTVIQSTEYTLYQNIFMNNQGKDYDNTAVTKKGTFAVINDEYNSVVRYFVWGYNDQTKCCDWQWELDPKDKENLPTAGSLVEVSGTFKEAESSLDGYWIENAAISVLQKYNGNSCDIDMTTMGGTLERVQVANMQQYPDRFEGKTICAYGRMETLTSLQHPYYDNCFSLEFESENQAPAIGTDTIIRGKYSGSKIVNATITEDAQYNQVIV